MSTYNAITSESAASGDVKEIKDSLILDVSNRLSPINKPMTLIRDRGFKVSDLGKYVDLTQISNSVNLKKIIETRLINDPKKFHRKFQLLQKWQGIVLEVNSDHFKARLIDLLEEGPDEETDFPLTDVDDGDIGFLETGSIFYWSIFYQESPNGETERRSRIRFRRIPQWDREYLDDAEKDAEKLWNELGWDKEV